jgi:hypothetical protein
MTMMTKENCIEKRDGVFKGARNHRRHPDHPVILPVSQRGPLVNLRVASRVRSHPLVLVMPSSSQKLLRYPVSRPRHRRRSTTLISSRRPDHSPLRIPTIANQRRRRLSSMNRHRHFLRKTCLLPTGIVVIVSIPPWSITCQKRSYLKPQLLLLKRMF